MLCYRSPLRRRAFISFVARRVVSVDKTKFGTMAENFYSVKTALHVGIVQILSGLISIGIGAFNTRKEDHQAFFKFKPEGLPVWSGILVCIKN